MNPTTGGFTSGTLAAQAVQLQFAAFTPTDALNLGALALAIAQDRALPVTMEIWYGDRLIFKAALPGTTEDNDDWLRRKRNVVEKFDNSTLAVRVMHEENDQEFNEATGLPLSEYAAHGGGWPIHVVGTGTVGFMGVSGLPQVEDHLFIEECLSAYHRTRLS